MHDSCAAVNGIMIWLPVHTAVVPTASDGSMGAMSDNVTGES